MSITITTDIFCDWCQISLRTMVSSHPNADHAVSARVVAKQHGWGYEEIEDERKDLCPDCKRLRMLREK